MELMGFCRDIIQGLEEMKMIMDLVMLFHCEGLSTKVERGYKIWNSFHDPTQ